MTIGLSLLLLLSATADAKKPRKADQGPAAPVAPTPVEGSAVPVPCNFVPGQTWRYHAETRDLSTSEQGVETGEAKSWDYDITVVSNDEAHAVLEIREGKATFIDPPDDPMTALVYDVAGKAVDGLPARVEREHATMALRVTNLGDFTRAMSTVPAAVIAEIPKRFPLFPAENLPAMEGYLGAMLSNESLMSAAILSDTFGLGYSCLTLQKWHIELPTLLPSPFGGEPLPAVQSVHVTGGPGTLRFVDEVRAENVRAAPLINSMSAAGAIPASPGDEKALDSLTFTSIATRDVNVSLTDGWPLRWSVLTTTTAGRASSVKSMVVTRVE